MGATPGTVTFLITDLVGSTQLLGEIGDDAFEAIRRRHFRMLRAAVAGRGGREVKNLGDGLMVVFDSATEATEAAIAMQQAVHHAEAKGDTVGLGVRIGLQVGEPIRDEEDYFGLSVVMAKRLCDTAGAGQIVASDLVRGLVGTRSGFRFEELGERELKGIGRPVRAYSVVWEPATVQPVPLPALSGERDGFAFVGRGGALRTLDRARVRAARSGITFAVIEGDAGVGKTCLAAEFCRRSHGPDAVVLAGHCIEDALVPYAPLAEALRGYVAACPLEDLRLQVAAHGGELLRIVPELADRLPHLQEASNGERHRLFAAVAAFLVEVARSRQLVLLLEDIHWADPPTLLLLRHLSRECRAAPILVVATVRSHEASDDGPLAQTVAELRRDDRLERITLGGLDHAEVDELLRGWSGQDVSHGFVGTLVAETEGNPLFVRETLRHLQETGVLRMEGGRWAMSRPIHEVGVPQGVRDVIGRRLSRLETPHRRILELAAVIGRDFTLDLVERADGTDTGTAVDALDAALAAGLVNEDGEAPGRFRFSHALIRETLYQSLSATRRARTHGRVGEALEALAAHAEPGPHLGQLARHFVAAASPATAERAVAYSERAGAYDDTALAYEDAVAQYRNALSALAQLPVRDEPRRCELLVRLGEALWKAGEHRAARETLWEAAELAQELGADTLIARAALGIAGPWVTSGHVDDRLIALLELALANVASPDLAVRSRLLGALAEQLVFLTERAGERFAVAEEAVRTARASGDPAALAEALRRATWATWSADNLSERLAMTAEMVELTEQAGGSTIAAAAPGWRICCMIECGDADAVDREMVRYEALAAEYRQPYLTWHLALHRTLRAHMDGRFGEVEELAQEALSLAPDTDNAVQMFGAQIVMNRRSTGAVAELLPAIEDFVDRFPRIPGWRAVLAVVLLDDGRTAQAEEEFAKLARGRFSGIPRDMFWLPAIALCCEVAGALGDRTRARDLFELVRPYGDHNVVLAPAAGCIGSMSRQIGTVAGLLGERALAISAFESAIAMETVLRAPPLVAESRLAYARMLARTGAADDQRTAWELTEAARQAAVQFGMATLGHRATELLLDLAEAGAAPARLRGSGAGAHRS